MQETPEVLDDRLRAALADIPSPYISDGLGRLTGIVGLHRFNRKERLIGTAFTVKTRPGDNLYVYRALHDMRPGHVLVVDAAGKLDNAIVGELMQLYARSRGCTGFVIDGAIRDVATFRETDFPCYARGVCHRGPFKSGPGFLNVPVCIGGQVVNPGDIILGDEDGIVSFAPVDAEQIIVGARDQAIREEAIKVEIASGAGDQNWIAAHLAATDRRNRL